jgi:transcriptional regulator with XRE-family HTH domain
MSDFLKLFGNKIRIVRKAKGLTQEELAENCGLQNTYIGGIERGERNISLQSVERLAEGLGVVPFELFKFDDLKLYDISNDKSALIEKHINLLLTRTEEETKSLLMISKEILDLMDNQKNRTI